MNSRLTVFFPLYTRIARWGFVPLALLFCTTVLYGQGVEVRTGADQLEAWLPSLAGKKVGLVCHNASRIGSILLPDTLLAVGVDVKLLLTPEHGLLSNASAGAHVGDSSWKGIPVSSLYGKNREPSPAQLGGLDVVLFDLQDVGVRCYTYASTLHLVMRACARGGVPLLLLDRPNPLGGWVDGPVREAKHESFVGMHPVPLLHGLTLGELARMINGEGWLGDSLRCELEVITCQGYQHDTRYELPVPPSPNLPNIRSILLYPTLVLLEGSHLSVGRGTEAPFQCVGGPQLRGQSYRFTPRSVSIASDAPHAGKECHGVDLRGIPLDSLYAGPPIRLELIAALLRSSDRPRTLLTKLFDRLAGTDSLRRQLLEGKSPAEIRATWAKPLEEYRLMRDKYLLYPDANF